MNGYGRMKPLTMTSTGNDLVSLQATRPERTCLPRFYSRILSAAEAAAYDRLDLGGLPFDHYVWLCWSVKESAYKYQKRQFPELVFAPLRIVIREIIPPDKDNECYRCLATGPIAGNGSLSNGSPSNGSLSNGSPINGSPSNGSPATGSPTNAPQPDGSADVLFARSTIRDGVIHTIASEDQEFTDTHWGFGSIDSPAYADQSAAVRTLALSALKNKLPEDDLRLQKDAAGCPMVITGKTAIPVSLSHHDRYVAYSFRYSASNVL